MVMFDSLNRHMLPPYGCDWTHAPNFARLVQRCVTFDNAYVCSMPCMPARRDLHSGRPNFLHRAWGPIEPFDDSMPELLKQNGVYTHLASDHYHYWEDGGATYHTRYNSWEFFRGQEGDPWIGQVAEPPETETVAPFRSARRRQDEINRTFMHSEQLQPQARTFAAGLDFLRRNTAEDNWFLQIETFDPHEPFFSHRKYKDLYKHEYSGPRFDWPPYRKVEENAGEVQHCRMEYAALLSMCDAYLGDVLDAMDEYSLWNDTLLIVNTDHGFLLGEHESWAKGWCPWYQELAHIPMFIWDPRCRVQGERRHSLVQTIDLAPTLLEYFGVELPCDMLGQPLCGVIENDTPAREAAIFGVFGGHVNVTDGRYTYMRAPVPENTLLWNYTLMGTEAFDRFRLEPLRQAELAAPFSFTKGCPTLRVPGQSWFNKPMETLLFDLEADPGQQHPLQDEAIEKSMIAHLDRLLRECDAPCEQWERLGLNNGQLQNATI